MVLSFEDSPIFDWYKKNRIFILFLIIIVFGGNAYLYFAPGMAKENNAKEWTRFQTRTAEIDLKENFAAQISAAKDDAITFPWFLYTATRAALQSNDETALSLLKNELLALDASSDQWKGISAEGEPLSIRSLLVDIIEGQANLPTFVNPEPKGSSYLITISDSLERTYEISISLYSEVKQAAMWLEDNVDALVGQEIENFNNLSLTINGLTSGSPTGELQVERNRLFHEAGTISTLPTGETDGSQKQDVLQILLEDNYMADGISTVIGKITSGLEDLKTAIAEQKDEEALKITAVKAI